MDENLMFLKFETFNCRWVAEKVGNKNSISEHSDERTWLQSQHLATIICYCITSLSKISMYFVKQNIRRDMWMLFAKEARDIHTIPYPWWKLSIEYCWWSRNLASCLTLGRCTMGWNKCAAGAVGQNSFISSVIQMTNTFHQGGSTNQYTNWCLSLVTARSFFAFSFIHSAFPGVLCRTMRRRTDPTFR